MERNAQLCTFWLDQQLFGLDVVDVREVIAAPRVTPIPLAAPALAGLINLRGDLVPAVSLRLRLGMAPGCPSHAMSIIVRTSVGLMSLLVDEIGEIACVTPEQRRCVPAHMDEGLRGLTDAVYEVGGALLIALDAEQVTDLTYLVGADTTTPRSGGSLSMDCRTEGP